MECSFSLLTAIGGYRQRTVKLVRDDIETVAAPQRGGWQPLVLVGYFIVGRRRANLGWALKPPVETASIEFSFVVVSDGSRSQFPTC